MTAFEIGTRVRVITDQHPRAKKGREGVVVPCPCGLTHGDAATVAVDGSRSGSNYLLRFDELEVIE